jgi:uncharacterized protein (TIGR00661 family)
MEKISTINVLVCPLNWGIGHATRCVPVIRELEKKGFRVIIGADGLPLEFLRQEFSDLQFCRFPGFTPSYPKNGSMFIKMLLQIPAFISGIIREHQFLENLVRDFDISLVISDNRYGVWHKKVKSILIIHQIMIKAPKWIRFSEPLLYLINRLMISRFDECWIPDSPGKDNLSGDLSHKYPLPRNARFVGPLSRFKPKTGERKTGGFILALISGPEPQRSIFEGILTRQLSGLNLPCTILTGKPGSSAQTQLSDNVTLVPHLPTNELQNLLYSASAIICRSGYSTIMDLAATGAKALFIPTSGQTEQEYLAAYHEQEGNFTFMRQNETDLASGIDRLRSHKGITATHKDDLLEANITQLAVQFGIPS